MQFKKCTLIILTTGFLFFCSQKNNDLSTQEPDEITTKTSTIKEFQYANLFLITDDVVLALFRGSKTWDPPDGLIAEYTYHGYGKRKYITEIMKNFKTEGYDSISFRLSDYSRLVFNKQFTANGEYPRRILQPQMIGFTDLYSMKITDGNFIKGINLEGYDFKYIDIKKMKRFYLMELRILLNLI